MKNQHFKWVPHFLDDDLRAKRLEGIRQLRDVLQAQDRCQFRGLISGDETWVSLDMKPGTIWYPADAELPIRVKRAIASEKCMLIVLWGIHGIRVGAVFLRHGEPPGNVIVMVFSKSKSTFVSKVFYCRLSVLGYSKDRAISS
jgi:hypothetical protein